ncbi:MAG: hypothetical protein ACE5J4_03415 [Candidatus Aenigmatarchaeota archaeon]
MERVGILVVSYGSRAAAMVDAFSLSENYNVEFYIIDKQKNPYNHVKIAENGGEHIVIPTLEINGIHAAIDAHKDEIDFGIVGPEGPIIDGIRDRVEEQLDIPMICPTKEYAIENSKVLQRELIQDACSEANPRFKVFDPEKYDNSPKDDVYAWLDELDNQCAVKPDKPAVGKGVGIWGDHFNTREELYEHFIANYQKGPVIIEEKVDGEEFSLQFFSDGKHLIPTPTVRDYKRAFDGDRGPNTGGMGSYKDISSVLPFMSNKDWFDAQDIGDKIFEVLKGGDDGLGLRGTPMYMAYICAAKGLKILEINSRPGDPEIQNLLPILQNDFVDVCYKMIDGNLGKHGFDFKPKATVVTYAVPMTYGGYRESFSGDTRVDLSKAYESDAFIYPGSMEIKNGETHTLSSRTVCAVGVGDSIEEARNISLGAVRKIDGPLWNRWDIGSKEHINKSIEHMKKLRNYPLTKCT